MKTLTNAEILALPMPENDASAPTIGAFLVALLHKLWYEQDGFSGKRPFGNGGWDTEVIIALVNAETLEGSFDEDGCIETYDQGELDRIILSAIDSLDPNV